MIPAHAHIYISGPMTGYAEYNFPAFNQLAAQLRAQGYAVSNPAEHVLVDDHGVFRTWQSFMREDIREVSKADVLVVLPGWEKSRGARAEVVVARMLALPVLTPDLLDAVIPESLPVL